MVPRTFRRKKKTSVPQLNKFPYLLPVLKLKSLVEKPGTYNLYKSTYENNKNNSKWWPTRDPNTCLQRFSRDRDTSGGTRRQPGVAPQTFGERGPDTEPGAVKCKCLLSDRTDGHTRLFFFYHLRTPCRHFYLPCSPSPTGWRQVVG